MNLQMNQSSLTPLKGAVAMKINPMTIPVMVDPDSVATLVPGDDVVLTNTTGPVIYVDKAVATDVPFATVPYGPKESEWTAEMRLEVCLMGSILWAEASGSVTRGDQLEFVPTGSKQKTNAGNPTSGIALDNASDGELFRFLFLNPYAIPAAITSGSIDGTAIGGSNPSTVVATDLTASGIITLSGVIAGATPLVFEGATADAFETSFAITDPTADRTVTFPDASGTVSLLSQTALVIADSATPAFVPGSSGVLSTFTPGQSGTMAATVTGCVKGKTYFLEVVTSGTSSYTITFGSNMKTTGTLATGSSTAKTFLLAFMFDGTNLVEISRTTAM